MEFWWGLMSFVGPWAQPTRYIQTHVVVHTSRHLIEYIFSLEKIKGEGL